MKVWAGDETEAPAEAQVDLSNLTPSAEQGTTVTLNGAPKTAYQKNTVIASGTFTVSGYIDENGTISFTGDFRFHTTGMCQNDDGSIEERTSYDTKYDAHQNSEITIQGLPLGYQVHYESSLSGAKGIPTGTYYSYRDEETDPDEEYFTVEAEAPTLDGYKFIGWAINGEDDSEKYVQQGAEFAPGQNTTLTAMWEKVEETQTYTVKFDGVYTGVSNLPATTFVVKTDNTQVNAPNETPMREGYTFAGWAADKNSTTAVTFPYAISGDTTFYALWTRNQVKITWPLAVPAGVELTHPGTGNPTDTVTSVDLGKEVTLRIVLDERYEIGTVTAGDRVLGSTVNGNIYTYTFTADKDLTVAVGAPTVKKFTISLPQGDGYEATFVECKAYDATGFGSADLEEANDSTSYTFEYGDSFKIRVEAYADTTATLRVDGTKVFEVDGNSDTTSKITPTAYVVNKMYNITVGTKRKITRMVTFSLEPYGGLYTIMPVENGSKICAPAKPEIPGYEFGGWYKDAKFAQEWHFLPDQGATLTDEEKVTQTNAADVVKGNIVIYGKLTPKTYAVNYDANANGDATVSGIPGAQTKTHGVALTLANNTPTREGYTFKGWATSPTGPVAYQPGGQYLNDAPVTLYAVWEKLTYTVTISSGAGYSTVPAGAATVNWHDPFTFTVNVDRQYAATTPEVVDSVEDTLTATGGKVNHTGATSYTYEIGKNHKIEQNRTITITVT